MPVAAVEANVGGAVSSGWSPSPYQSEPSEPLVGADP